MGVIEFSYKEQFSSLRKKKSFSLLKVQVNTIVFSEFITSQGKHFIRTFSLLLMLNGDSKRVVFVF